jgi:hypothetical protein
MSYKSLDSSRIYDAEFEEVSKDPKPKGDEDMSGGGSGIDSAINTAWKILGVVLGGLILLWFAGWLFGLNPETPARQYRLGDGGSMDVRPPSNEARGGGGPWGPKTQTQIACNGKARGFPFNCGSASPTGLCICP